MRSVRSKSLQGQGACVEHGNASQAQCLGTVVTGAVALHEKVYTVEVKICARPIMSTKTYQYRWKRSLVFADKHIRSARDNDFA
jgi:hypothetical protein